MLFDVDFLHNKRSLSDARSKKFSFASVATATQIILATLPLYSQNATWRSSTANTAMNKPYNIQNTNICNGIFHISFFKALLINEGETTRGANGIQGEATRIPVVCSVEIERGCCQCTLPNLRLCGHWVLSSFAPLV